MPKKIAVWRHDRKDFEYLTRDSIEARRPPIGREDYGERCFTGSVAIQQPAGQRAIFRWSDHLDRFEQSVAADAMVKRLPCSRELLTNVVSDLVWMNDQPYIRCSIGSVGGVRVYAHDPQPDFHVCTEDIDPITRTYLGPDVSTKGLRVLVTDWRRGFPDAVTMAKSASNYQRSINAKDEAVQAGMDDGALVDSTGDYLSEASVANLILIKGQRAFRPDRRCGALDSITRRTAERLLKDTEQIETDPALIGPRLLEEADEIMACGTAIGCIRIRELAWPAKGVHWMLRRDEADQVALRIDRKYLALIQGQVLGYDNWFTPIESMHAQTVRT